MKLLSRRGRGAAIAVFLACATAVLLSACTSSSQSSSSAAASASATPKSGGTLNLAVLSDGGCIDPQQISSLDDAYAARQVVDSLTDQNPTTGALVPWLATSWTVSDDSKTFTFHLRSGVTFSNGTPLTAQVVKDNFDAIEKLGALASLAQSYLTGYEGTTVDGPLTATVRFSSPNAQFLQATSTFNLGLVSASTTQESASQRCSGIIGSGPFVQGKYVQNQSLTLIRRADYKWPSKLWSNQGPAYLAKVVVHIVPEDSVRLGSLESGELNVIAGVTAADAKVIDASGDSVLVHANPGVPLSLAANNSAPIVSDKAVREAISDSINRAAIASAIYVAGTLPATSVLASSTPAYEDLKSKLSYDLSAADKLLTADGWVLNSTGYRYKDGKELTVTVTWTNGAVGNEAMLELIQEQAKAAGINLQLKELDQAPWVAAWEASDFQLILTSSTRADGDILRTNFSTALSNLYKLPKTSLDTLFTEETAASNTTTRDNLIKEIQTDMVDNYYIIPVVELTTAIGVAKDVHGLVLDSTSRLRLQDAWIS